MQRKPEQEHGLSKRARGIFFDAATHDTIYHAWPRPHDDEMHFVVGCTFPLLIHGVTLFSYSVPHVYRFRLDSSY